MPPEIRNFETTHWSIVLSAGRIDSVAAREALQQLCRTYWYPLYAFVRRYGHSPEDAQDLTQAYFLRLLEKDYLADVDPGKGRFRSFLLGSVKHFLANEWDRVRAQKRGGGQRLVSLDNAAVESRYALEPADSLTPENLFERSWALVLLDTTLDRLREEFVAEGKASLFDSLKFTLTSGRGSTKYAELAAKLDMSEGSIKVAVHRLRGRYRELLRAQIAETVLNQDDVEGELRFLFRVLGSV